MAGRFGRREGRQRARAPLRAAALAAALVAAAGVLAGCNRPSERPNLLFVVVDALRKDALHLYGNPEPVSPHLDALAARGWTFDKHVAHSSQTVPSMLTMLLSQLPAHHGFRFQHPHSIVDERPVYPEQKTFLAEVLSDAGYVTVGYSANPYLTESNGFDQGFDVFGTTTGRGEVMTAAAEVWLKRWGRGRRVQPFFLYVHYMDVHQPYDPPEPWRSRFVREPEARPFAGNRRAPQATEAERRYSRALYTACTAYVDDQIGRLLAQLEGLGVREDTIVVVTADHGEEFLEHGGIGHGRTVYGEVVRVPLILSAPGRLPAGDRVTHLSRHLDLAPTLLSLLGVPSPPSFHGKSVLRPARRALLETAKWQGVYRGQWHLVRSPVLGRELLFDHDDELDREPLENSEVLPALHAEVDEYVAMLRDAATAPARRAEPARAWSREEVERLRALGYAD